MRIIDTENERFPLELCDTVPGDCVRFEHVFHQKHAVNATFLVLRVPTEYIRHEKRNRDGEFRIMVANLATGDTSLITTARRVRRVNAEVVIK